MKPQIERLNTGLAGEYLVAGIMHQKGWIASLTLKNYPGVDIFGLNNDSGLEQKANIQVKTTRDNTFWVGLKHSEISQIKDIISGPYVFVHLPKEGAESKLITTNVADAEFYVLSREQVINLIVSSDNAYQEKDRDKPLKDDYSIALLYKRDLLPRENEFKDRWENLWKE